MTTNPEEEESFLAAIEADPNNDGKRLIYADWLEDQGDRRAELLRLSVAVYNGDQEAAKVDRLVALLPSTQAMWRYRAHASLAIDEIRAAMAVWSDVWSQAIMEYLCVHPEGDPSPLLLAKVRLIFPDVRKRSEASSRTDVTGPARIVRIMDSRGSRVVDVSRLKNAVIQIGGVTRTIRSWEFNVNGGAFEYGTLRFIGREEGRIVASKNEFRYRAPA